MCGTGSATSSRRPPGPPRAGRPDWSFSSSSSSLWPPRSGGGSASRNAAHGPPTHSSKTAPAVPRTTAPPPRPTPSPAAGTRPSRNGCARSSVPSKSEHCWTPAPTGPPLGGPLRQQGHRGTPQGSRRIRPRRHHASGRRLRNRSRHHAPRHRSQPADTSPADHPARSHHRHGRPHRSPRCGPQLRGHTGPRRPCRALHLRGGTSPRLFHGCGPESRSRRDGRHPLRLGRSRRDRLLPSRRSALRPPSAAARIG